MSPGITGTLTQLALYAARTAARQLRIAAARALRAAAVATCPCGACGERR